MSPPHVVIIGGGFGGLSAAKALRGSRRAGDAARPPQLPPLPAAAVPGGDGDAVARRHRVADPLDPAPRARTCACCSARPTRIDVGRAPGACSTDGATLDYDYLIVGTGARHAYFGHPEWAQYAPGLKTLEDALEIRRRVLLAFERPSARPTPARQQRAADVRDRRRRSDRRRAGRHAGGDRAADAARRVPRRSTPSRARIVAGRSRPDDSCRRFPEKLRDAARASLRRLGVEVLREASRVTAHRRPRRDGSASERARRGHGRCGRPASPRRRSLRRSARRSIAPAGCSSNRTCRSPAIPRSSSSATPPLLQQDGKPLPGVAQTAMQGAAHAARNDPPPDRGTSRRRRSSTATSATWRSSAVARRSPTSAGLRSPAPLAWLAWLFLHIFMLIGFRNRVVVLLQWAGAYFTFQRSVRLITYEDQLDRT